MEIKNSVKGKAERRLRRRRKREKLKDIANSASQHPHSPTKLSGDRGSIKSLLKLWRFQIISRFAVLYSQTSCTQAGFLTTEYTEKTEPITIRYFKHTGCGCCLELEVSD